MGLCVAELREIEYLTIYLHNLTITLLEGGEREFSVEQKVKGDFITFFTFIMIWIRNQKAMEWGGLRRLTEKGIGYETLDPFFFLHPNSHKLRQPEKLLRIFRLSPHPIKAMRRGDEGVKKILINRLCG